MLPAKNRAIIPLHRRSVYIVISTICFYLAVVDSYVPSHPWKPLPNRVPMSLSVSSSSSSSTKSIQSEPFTQVNKSNNGASSNSNKNDPSYIQWSHQKDVWKMQTAVTTFQKGDQKVELHAQQHYGDADYFRYWNSQDDFNKNHDCVLFELLVDDELLEYKRGDWRVTQPIMASTNDRLFATNLGLQCQASIIDYTNHKWAHADLSRQEFAKLATENNNNQGEGNNSKDSSSLLDYGTPLWKLASPESSSTAAEAVAALMVGPPTLDYNTKTKRKRRLFTNLFLPGGNLAFTLRAILWMTVPAPELSIILLDWSSLLQGGSNPSVLSEVALPILFSLVKFDIDQMRRFLYGQVVMSSKNNNGGGASGSNENLSSSWSLLVIDRNDHAMKILKKKLEEKNVNSVALLYGSSHCPDLHNKLVAMGFQQTKTTWRTAWSVQESTSAASTTSSSSTAASTTENGSTDENRGLPALGIFLVFYLIVGALDWVGIVGDASASLFDANYLDAGVDVISYLVRHVFLYLGLSKFLIDWTNTDR